MPVRQAGNVLAGLLIEWCAARAKVWSWERCAKALLDCERRCLYEALGEGDVAMYVFDGRDGLDLWSETIEPWKREHDVTWLEAARIIHHEASSWLNYALRGERHPDDKNGEKKVDEA